MIIFNDLQNEAITSNKVNYSFGIIILQYYYGLSYSDEN